MNIAGYLDRSARCFPGRPAIAEGTHVIQTYASLRDRVAGLARALRGALPQGGRVVLRSHNRPEYLEALFAIWWAGLIAVPVNAKLHPVEIDYIMAHCGSGLLLGDGGIDLGGAVYEGFTRLAGVDPAPVLDDDPAWIFYTSGTTGRPKGATLTHSNLRAMCHAFLTDVVSVEPGDAMVHAAQLSHGSGLYALPHVVKAAVNVTLPDGKFDAVEVERLLRAWPGSATFGPPTVLRPIIEQIDPAVWARSKGPKALIFGGGPLYEITARAAFAATGGRIAQIYGQGETPCTITSITPALYRALAADRWDSVGVPQSGIEVRIADESDAAVADGEVGEVLVRGATVMTGYWNAPEANEAALRGGWLHTGDMGLRTPDGFVTLKDRSKDVIISGGFNVYPREVEEVLLRHPGVAEVSVVGRRSERWGEEVLAHVVAKAGHVRPTSAELDALCLSQIARFKRPRAYLFRDSLPKNAYGKVLKRELVDA